MKKQKAIYLKPMVWEDCGFTCHKKYTSNPPITWIYFLIYFFFYLTKTLFCSFSKFISINMLSQILEWKKNEWNTVTILRMQTLMARGTEYTHIRYSQTRILTLLCWCTLSEIRTEKWEIECPQKCANDRWHIYRSHHR